MTNIPMAVIEPLSELHYGIIRSIVVPFSRLSRTEVLARARVVHRGLLEMAASRQFELFEQDPSWFGPDVIHVLYWKRKAYYRQLFEQLRVPDDVTDTDRSGIDAGWTKHPRVAYQKVLGHERRRQQPSGRLGDDTVVYMY